MSRDNFPMWDTKRNSPDSSPRPQSGSGPSATVRSGKAPLFGQVTKDVPAPSHKHKGHSNGPGTGASIRDMAPNPSATHHSKG